MAIRMTSKEFREKYGGEKRITKYRNAKTESDNITFDSKAEAMRYEELKLLKRTGEIKGFGIQPSFVIGPKMRYIPDFIVCGNDGLIWVEDVKGKETDVFKIKKKLFEDKYPWITLRIVR